MSVQSTEPAAAPPPDAPPPAAQPAVPAPPQPAAPAAAAPVPQAPREPDGRFAAVPPPAQPAAAADGTDWKAVAETARAEAVRLKTEADQWKAQSRRQEQRSKTNHQELQQERGLLRLVAEKLGVEYDDRPDPDVLQQRLSEQTTLARQRAVELAVYQQAAGAQNLNASSLLDSREFMSRTAALDPDAADFHSQLADLVREAAGQPRYQFQQPPPPAPAAEPVQQPPAQPQQQQAPAQPPTPQPPAPASGADFSGAPRQSSLWTQADYDGYMASAKRDDRDGKKLSAAIDAGLLSNLGIGRPKKRAGR
jgi:hypothetical protein